MAHKPPPILPEERSPNGDAQRSSIRGARGSKTERVPENLKEQDQQGNTYQNTHNQGYQQDR